MKKVLAIMFVVMLMLGLVSCKRNDKTDTTTKGTTSEVTTEEETVTTTDDTTTDDETTEDETTVL